jgi:ABC-type glycerol-3-phosphate transport system substrate-binding protein
MTSIAPGIRAATLVLLAGLAGCGADGRTELLIYSPHGRDMLQAFARVFEEEHPDVQLAANAKVLGEFPGY